MLTGHRVYINPVTQATICQRAYFNQVVDLSFKALRACSPRDLSAYFHNLVQQSGLCFMDFLTSTTEAVERRVNP